jgi:hypothetical protein
MKFASLIGFVLLLTGDAQIRASPGRKLRSNSTDKTLEAASERRLQTRIKFVGNDGSLINKPLLGLCEGDVSEHRNARKL